MMSLWTSWRAAAKREGSVTQVANTEVPDPVFILGHWRSGTTLFHNLLALDEQFAYPAHLPGLEPTQLSDVCRSSASWQRQTQASTYAQHVRWTTWSSTS